MHPIDNWIKRLRSHGNPYVVGIALSAIWLLGGHFLIEKLFADDQARSIALFASNLTFIALLATGLFLAFKSQNRMFENIREASSLDLISRASHDSFWIANVNPDTLERKITYVNPVFQEIWGRSPEKLRKEGCIYNRWIHEDDYESVGASLAEFLNGNAKCDLDFRIRRPSGEIRWIWTKAERICDAQGRISQVVGISRDITSKKFTELQLQESERRFRSLFEATQDAIQLCDLNGSFIEVNDAFLELTGYSKEELKSRTNQSVTSPASYAEESAIIRNKVLHSGSSEIYEKEIVRKDGSKVQVNTRSSLLASQSGTPTGVFGVSRDISLEVHQREELIAAKKNAESANDAKNRFLAVVSHELRTPLNPIIGYADLLLGRISDTESREFLKIIQDSAHHMTNLISDILDFAKIESGKTEIENSVFRLQELFSTISAQTRGFAKESENELIIDYRWLNCAVKSDFGKIRQILTNLIINACKFTTKSTVTLTGDLLCESKGIHTFRIQVTDTGRGIPKDQLKTIFQPFEQATAINGRNRKGVGLGLAICQELVTALSGKIAVESDLGKGSTFTVDIPMQVIAASEEMPIRENPPIREIESDRYKVLIVEDNSANLTLTKEILSKCGCRVSTAVNGAESVERMKRESYDMVFMDLAMPKMNGIEAASCVRKSACRNRNTPIVAMTADLSHQTRNACLKSGMNEFLKKPITRTNLQNVLDRWLK